MLISFIYYLFDYSNKRSEGTTEAFDVCFMR